MKMIICASCGKEKPHEAKGLCRHCYRNQPLQKLKSKNYNKRYYNNHPNHSTIWNHKNFKCVSMTENKSCSSFLGVHIAERVLSKVFKNVQTMPYGHKGFDFICGKGYKVDVKSRCASKRDNNWCFDIRKNTIADYFLMLAFDNREDLNPLYMWLIPGDVVNHLKSVTISVSTLNKWNEYKLDIDKVIKYCKDVDFKNV